MMVLLVRFVCIQFTKNLTETKVIQRILLIFQSFLYFTWFAYENSSMHRVAMANLQWVLANVHGLDIVVHRETAVFVGKMIIF